MENSNIDLNHLIKLIKRPIITEKAIKLNKNYQYAFLVDKSLNKNQIKKAIEALLNVIVNHVRTCNLPPQMKQVGRSKGQLSRYKKAYVELKNGESIETLFN